MRNNLIIDELISIDDSGMPIAPSLRQLLDTDVKELYRRDKTTDKKQYIAECIVIYYLGDPKSPANQSGLSTAEALKLAIEQAGLPDEYIPDSLVLKLVDKYHKRNIGEAGKTVDNLLKTIHNINLTVEAINNLLNEKLHTVLTLDEISTVMSMVENVQKIAGNIPTITSKLKEAKQNLMYEKETEVSRGGGAVLSSMDAEDYTD